MVQIVSPQPKTEKVLRIILPTLSAVFLLCVAAAFILVFQLDTRLQELGRLEEIRLAALTEQVDGIQAQLDKLPRADTRRLEERLKALEDLRIKTDQEIAKLKKENEVMLLNNRDFIKMFEQIQNDIDGIRLNLRGEQNG